MKVQKNFGSKRGLLAFVHARLLMIRGDFDAYQKIDFERVRRLVFVCKGNICRSAYAEAYARKVGINCVSVGIEATMGCLANDRAVVFAGQLGTSLEEHYSRRLDQHDYSDTDLLIGMEPQHLGPMHAQSNGAQMTLLGLWAVPRKPYLHDPYNASDEYMRDCFKYIEGCVNSLVAKLPPSARV